MSLHVLVLANKNTRYLDRLLYQLKGQTTPPDVVTVLANIAAESEHIPEICGTHKGVLLNNHYDVPAVRRYQDAYEAYDALPSGLQAVFTDYLMVLRDSDQLHFECLETLVSKFTGSSEIVVTACKYYKVSKKMVYPGNDQELSHTNFTFSNSMLYTNRVKEVLEYWEPDGLGEGNDYELIFRMLKRKSLVVAYETLVHSDPRYWREHEREQGKAEVEARKSNSRR